MAPCASRTMRMICASTVSPPTRVARMRMAPARLSVAPTTGLPARLATGVGSPVSIASSTEVVPSSTTPSTGIVSPGRTSNSSPVRTWSSGRSVTSPPRTTCAVSGRSATSFRMAAEVRPLARASR